MSPFTSNSSHAQYIEEFRDLILSQNNQNELLIEVVEFLKKELPHEHDEIVIFSKKLKKEIAEYNAEADKYLERKKV